MSTYDTNGRTVIADSSLEQYAYLSVTFGTPPAWELVSQTHRSRGGVTQLVNEIRTEGGEDVEVAFVESGIRSRRRGEMDDEPTELMDIVLDKAATFAAENPPNHPGSFSLFPVPSASYDNAVSVPLPILAQDEGARGIYAPPRLVALSWEDGSVIGVGEYPDFDPEHWPPPRLGDWPPPAVQERTSEEVKAIAGRFSACWTRVLDTWVADAGVAAYDPTDDVREALTLRALLDVPAMGPYYDRLNRDFAEWLAEVAEER